MTKGYFITGTGTDVGKTYVAIKILYALKQQGFSTAGLKPIASGCIKKNGNLHSEDALALQEAATIQLPYHQVNPIALQPPIAPHLAAKQIGKRLTVDYLFQLCQPLLNSGANRIIVEGAGGWLVPLNEKEMLADFATRLGFPIILVVGMKLGCINHALLTCQHMKTHDVNIAGWIANCIDPNMQALEENIATLKTLLPIPLITMLQHCENKIAITL